MWHYSEPGTPSSSPASPTITAATVATTVLAAPHHHPHPSLTTTHTQLLVFMLIDLSRTELSHFYYLTLHVTSMWWGWACMGTWRRGEGDWLLLPLVAALTCPRCVPGPYLPPAAHLPHTCTTSLQYHITCCVGNMKVL